MREKHIQIRSKRSHHGMRGTKEYRAWNCMKHRCYNKNDESYKHYGGRGIIVCDRWMESFQNFFDDVGLAPSFEYTIDRINSNGNYEPGNVRWATKKEQGANTRKATFVTINGVTKRPKEWAAIIGISDNGFYSRMVAKDKSKPLDRPLKRGI